MRDRFSDLAATDVATALRDEQAAHRRTRNMLAGWVAFTAMSIVVGSMLWALKLAEVADSLYWAQRRGDFWFGEASRGCRRRDVVLPAVERAGRL